LVASDLGGASGHSGLGGDGALELLLDRILALARFFGTAERAGYDTVVREQGYRRGRVTAVYGVEQLLLNGRRVRFPRAGGGNQDPERR